MSISSGFVVAAVIATLLYTQGVLVDGARIKIHLATDSVQTAGRLRPRQVPQSACNDIQEIDGTTLPQNIQDGLDSRVKFYSSAAAKKYIDAYIFTRKVSGLGEQTVRHVFNMLFSEGCYPFFYGGLVRDQFLGRQPGDVDVEADCNIYRVYNICIATWGEQNCIINENSLRAHIGKMVNSPDDLLDFASTNSTFFAPLSNLEYTVNSLAYDLNGVNNVIIDLPGNGVFDVCNESIRIPSDDGLQQSWDAWRTVPGGRGKLYRFWKLRTKNLMPINDATLQYIVQNTIMAIEDDPDSFKKFYCDAVYGHGYFNNETKTCVVKKEMCEDKASKAESYKQRFSEDFGDYYSTSLETDVIPTATCGKYILGT